MGQAGELSIGCDRDDGLDSSQLTFLWVWLLSRPCGAVRHHYFGAAGGTHRAAPHDLIDSRGSGPRLHGVTCGRTPGVLDGDPLDFVELMRACQELSIHGRPASRQPDGGFRVAYYAPLGHFYRVGSSSAGVLVRARRSISCGQSQLNDLAQQSPASSIFIGPARSRDRAPSNILPGKSRNFADGGPCR